MLKHLLYLGIGLICFILFFLLFQFDSDNIVIKSIGIGLICGLIGFAAWGLGFLIVDEITEWRKE